MASTLPVPPTYADPVLVDEKSKRAIFNPIWLRWFLDLSQLLLAAASGSTAEHNNLLSIQGGNPTERYHFTSAEHTLLQAYTHNSLNSLQGGAASEYYHFTNAQHTLLAAYDHESLNGLLGGAASDHYHLTGAQHTLLVAYDHESLNGLLGGAASDHYHLTSAEHTTATAGPSQAVTAITVGASPSTWHNTTGFNVVVSVNGAAGDTYTLSRDNATFYQVGTGANLSVVVPRGDYLKTTYAGAAPALNYFAM